MDRNVLKDNGQLDLYQNGTKYASRFVYHILLKLIKIFIPFFTKKYQRN